MKVQDLNLRKGTFAKFLCDVFQPRHFNNKSIFIVEFPDFIPFKNNESESKPFSQPGVYGIHCFATNSTLIAPSLNVRSQMIKDFIELDNGYWEYSKKLQKEFNKYSDDCFIFIIFCTGPELLDFDTRCQEAERISSVWPYNLYKR